MQNISVRKSIAAQRRAEKFAAAMLKAARIRKAMPGNQARQVAGLVRLARSYNREARQHQRAAVAG